MLNELFVFDEDAGARSGKKRIGSATDFADRGTT